MIFPLLPLYAQLFNASNFTIGALAASFAVAQLIVSPLWGILSDKYGRRPIIAIGLLGIAVNFFLFGLATGIFMLFISRFMQGIFSGALMVSARAYIADLTTPEERIRAMGYVGAALSLGVILGPAIGGMFAEINISLPFYAASVLALVNFFFVAKFIPESLNIRGVVPIRIKEILLTNLTAIPKGIRGPLGPLYTLAFIWSFALANNQVAVPLLAVERFSLGLGEIGWIFSITGIVAAFTQFFLITRIVSFIGERKTILLGLTILSLGFVAMPLLPPILGLLFLAGAIAGFGSAISRPTITALISKETTEEQGVTMGTASAFESLARLVGPLLGGFLFGFFIPLPFFFSAILVFLALLYIYTQTSFLKKKNP